MWATKQGYGTLKSTGIFGGTTLEASKTMIYLLGIEHIIAYCFNLYRMYEIGNYGKIDDQTGIQSAPNETRLKYVEIILDFIIFVIFIAHFFMIGNDEFNNSPLNYIFILVDVIIMFVSLPYSYVVQRILVASEITKNVFTLFQIQKGKLR